MCEFVRTVWKVVKGLNAASLRCFDKSTGETLEKEIRDYVVGAGVVALDKAGAILKHCAADVYYRSE
jgi:hypothetical protein